MVSLLRPITIGLILFLSIFNQIQARTVRICVCILTFYYLFWNDLQAKNDNDASESRVKRQINNRYPQPPADQSPSNEFGETYIQGSECKGCGPRRDCQCPGKGAMGITGALFSFS